jgi:hypothetical protein
VLYDNNKILLHSKLSSSDLSESDTCDEDENGAVRENSFLQIAHSKPHGG